MHTTRQPSTPPDVADRLIWDLVDEHPDVMAVLAPYGIDLCCGGGHLLGEALELHGIPREPVLSEVTRVVARQCEET